MRRSLHAFAKSSGVHYDPKNQKKLETDLQSALKKLKALEDVKFQNGEGLLAGVFFDDIFKTLRVHFGPRKLRLFTL